MIVAGSSGKGRLSATTCCLHYTSSLPTTSMETVARMQATARPRSSKRSMQVAFHPTEAIASPSHATTSGKPSSVSQSTALPASDTMAGPSRHRKSERLDATQRDPPSISTTSAIVRDEPRTAMHPFHGHQKKKDRTSSPDRRHSTRSHRIKALPSVPDDPEVDRKSGSMWRTLDEAQYEQAKKEVEELRKSAIDTKKLLKKQSKVSHSHPPSYISDCRRCWMETHSPSAVISLAGHPRIRGSAYAMSSLITKSECCILTPGNHSSIYRS